MCRHRHHHHHNHHHHHRHGPYGGTPRLAPTIGPLGWPLWWDPIVIFGNKINVAIITIINIMIIYIVIIIITGGFSGLGFS